MFGKIKKALAEAGCSIFEITEITDKCYEFYFIKKKLDMNRVVNTVSYQIKLYRLLDQGKMLGQASGVVSPTASDEELTKTVSDMYFQAGLVKNPVYDLNSDVEGAAKASEAFKTESRPAAEIAKDFLKMMQEIPETADKDINSFELFVHEYGKKFVNSNHVETESAGTSCMLEVVINARQEGHEIEVYRNYTAGDCDPGSLKADIIRAMDYGTDRLKAGKTPPDLDIPVIFSTKDSVEIYSWFTDKLSAGLIYRKMSDFEIGRPVCEISSGDTFTIRALPALPFSSWSSPVDEEGAVIKERVLMENNIPKAFWGSQQFSGYLGLKDSSIVHNFVVTGGSHTADELRIGDHLEIVEFSDFQVDPMGGDIAGEIRLAYLHKDGKTMIVSGGSVSGNMNDAAGKMSASSEQAQYDTCLIPSVTKMEGIRITGIS